jgi:hypothetical protein
MNSRTEGWACLVPCGLLVKVHTDPGICLSATRIATYQEHLVNCQPQECFVGSRGWERLADPFEAELSRPNMRPCSWNIAISNVKHECDLCQDCGEAHGLVAAVNSARNYSSSLVEFAPTHALSDPRSFIYAQYFDHWHILSMRTFFHIRSTFSGTKVSWNASNMSNSIIGSTGSFKLLETLFSYVKHTDTAGITLYLPRFCTFGS